MHIYFDSRHSYSNSIKWLFVKKNRAHLDPKVFPPQVEGGPTIPSPDEPRLPLPGLDQHFPQMHQSLSRYGYSTRSIFDEHGWLSSNNVEPRSWFIIMGLLYQRLQFIWRTTQLADYARTRPNTIQFRNVDVGTCMTSFPGFKGGVQLSTAPCQFGPDRFDFQPMVTRNGNYQLKSLSTGLCIRANF